VTGAVLRLIAKPAARATFLLAFADEFKALEASRAIFARGSRPRSWNS
jgi:hypothetical protein